MPTFQLTTHIPTEMLAQHSVAHVIWHVIEQPDTKLYPAKNLMTQAVFMRFTNIATMISQADPFNLVDLPSYELKMTEVWNEYFAHFKNSTLYSFAWNTGCGAKEWTTIIQKSLVGKLPIPLKGEFQWKLLKSFRYCHGKKLCKKPIYNSNSLCNDLLQHI